MSRATAHEYFETACGETLTETVKDNYLNKTRVVIFADLQPWGASHIQTNEATETKDSVALTANTQTEYAYPSTATAMDIKRIAVRADTSSPYYTARPVDPFEFGDPIADSYSDWTYPVYFLRNNKYIVYPQFTSIVTAAIKVYLYVTTLELSATNTTTGLSKEGERLWALKAAQKYYEASKEPIRALTMAKDYAEYRWSLNRLAPLPAKK